MIETLAHGCSCESTQQELSNEYQHDRVYMVFKNICILLLWTTVAPALKGLTKQHIKAIQELKLPFNKIEIFILN